MSKPLLPDFSRQQWVSAKARALWEPRIAGIGQHFFAAERASVGEIRSAALQNICPEQFPEVAQRAAKIGLIAIPLNIEGLADSYSASQVDRKGSDRWEYRVALTTPGKAGQFIEAWQQEDDETIGSLLGYPKCCRRFFAETWGSGSVDPTWRMADHGDGPVEANILLRWLGVRYIPHMPCGLHCEETIEFGRQFRRLIPEREREWMDILLSMPMLWSSLNGIAEVVTPIVTLNFRTDVNHELFEIHRQGTSYPDAGAYGLRFPYRSPAQRPDERLWTDNGFTSREAMEAGHQKIVSTLNAHNASTVSSLNYSSKIIDLGAGNGELLRKIGRGSGIESNAGRVDRRVWSRVSLGTIEHAGELFHDQCFAVAIISVRRFEELPEEDASRLRAWLERCVDRVLIYQYEHPQFARVVAPRDVPIVEVVR
ncbi:MAG: hypothetical protein GY783_02500 [Gammaproteobacteria bacterium]|nr:hypothetical protein [Gammaproteobacteria bacterium]